MCDYITCRSVNNGNDGNSENFLNNIIPQVDLQENSCYTKGISPNVLQNNLCYSVQNPIELHNNSCYTRPDSFDLQNNSCYETVNQGIVPEM